MLVDRAASLATAFSDSDGSGLPVHAAVDHGRSATSPTPAGTERAATAGRSSVVPRGAIGLGAAVGVVTGFGFDVHLTSEAEDVVDTTGERPCTRFPRCVQSAESSRIRIMRFDSKPAAEAYVLQLVPHGYQSDWFVVGFLQPQTMTRDDYRFVESGVYGTANDSPD